MTVNSDVARVRAASLLRELGHLMVQRDVDVPYLDDAASAVERLVGAAEAFPTRRRTAADLLAENAGPTPPDGDVMDHFAACPVTGQANPMGLAITVRRVGDAAVTTTALGPATEGMPGIAHGGVVAAIFDDLMGFVLTKLSGLTGVTASITVSYRAPVPIGVEVEFRSWLAGHDGRKLSIESTAHEVESGRLLTEATGLFIEVPIDVLAGNGSPG